MNDTKHTPGPWLYSHREGADGMYRTEVFSSVHGGIATCEWTPKNCGNGVTATYREANARLIAAAPDLLDALRGMIREFGFDVAQPRGLVHDEEEAIHRAMRAIAKATGHE